MASTNKTSNYELSQFLGSDKPAWLSDYNSDMNKIDTQMKANADAATAAGGAASAADGKIGTLADLTTDTKANLVAAVNEVDGHADVAQNTANSATSTANGANTKAETALTNINKFNLVNKSTFNNITTNQGTINASLTNVQFATDSSSSIFKIYGRVYIRNLGSFTGEATVVLGTTSLRPETAYDINSAVIVTRYINSSYWDIRPSNLHIDTNGTITFTYPVPAGATEMSAIISPCLYFNSDFGDA